MRSLNVTSSLAVDQNLYPYGLGQEDSRLPNDDDILSSSIALPSCFPFGRRQHRFAYVWNPNFAEIFLIFYLLGIEQRSRFF